MFAAGLVNLYTRDIGAGLNFYRDLLGFAETFRTPTEGIPEHVELRLNGCMRCSHRTTAATTGMR